MKYKAFISYRRSNGFLMAQVLHDRLLEKGITSFLDMEELGSGKFDEKILHAIQEAPNFLIILPKGALDRCVDADDWVRLEILTAVELGKNIIPVMYDGFEWPRTWDEKMPVEIQNLKYQNGVPGSQAYLSAMVDKIVSYMVGIDNGNSGKKRSELHIATSNLTVVDSLMQGWNCEEVFEKYDCTVEKHPYLWSDKILKDLAEERIDIAVYNKESCLKFNKENGAPIKIVRDVCSSMGGRNFYILASKKGKWKDMTLQQFKESIDSNTIFGISKTSDMYQNLLYILDMSEQELEDRGVKIMDYHSGQGLEIFNFLPDLLIIAGQDIRFLAERTGNFFEIISYDDFPQEKKQFFYKNSINALLIGPSGLKKLADADIDGIGIELMLNFYKNALSHESLKELKKRLSRQLGNICYDDSSIDYIVKNIIFETYRIM